MFVAARVGKARKIEAWDFLVQIIMHIIVFMNSFVAVILECLHDFQAFSSLAEAAYENAETSDENSEPNTYCLSSYFETIVQRLLETTDR